MEWFLLDSIKAQIDRAKEACFVFNEDAIAIIERASASNGVMVEAGNTAVIRIEGVLTEKRDVFAAFFGGGNTLYPDIVNAVKKANEEYGVDSITLAVGYSPGGSVLGMIEAMDAIRNSEKPVHAVVRNGALSAAYGLVSQADTITAMGRGTQFGSVGVAMDTSVYPSEISIANTESPNKRPDLRTDDGRAVVRDQLDGMYSVFAETIAAGRGTTVETINKDYGRGSILLANQALKAGMIDAINDSSQVTKTEAKRAMDLEKMRAEFPALYAEIIALGAAKERDRVCSHLILGEASGDMKTAVQAVNDGAEMTSTITAKYQAAAMNKQSLGARVDDNPDTEGLRAEPEAESYEEQVAREYEKLMGRAV